MEKKEGYLSEGGRICDQCAYELRVMEKPSAYYFDENDEKFDKMTQKHFVDQKHVSILPTDAVKIDEDFIYPEEDDDDYSNYYTKKALCFTCGEINYAEPVYESEERSRMICCDCLVSTCS